MHNINHTDLIARLVLGDERAFEAIYRLYARSLYQYARRNIAIPEDCEEIVQDVFASLWQRHHELAHITALEPYLYRTVKYKVIRYFQHHRVQQKFAEHYRLFEAAYETTPEESNPFALRQAIEKALANLPGRCQQAVKLRLWENLSNTDIAQRMNLSKGTVENYMVMAVSHLKALYKQQPSALRLNDET